MNFLADYVRRHEPGNPQLPIDRFLKEPEPKEEPVPPEDLRLMRGLIRFLEEGYKLKPSAAQYHRRLATQYLDRVPEAKRLLELSSRL